jgi:nucleoside 2-deoxyribosyltransferase-like protein
MIEIKAPNVIGGHYNSWMKIFLAGSIEMGVAEAWQSRVADDMKDYEVVLLNPRRDDWDSSWVQRADNRQFAQQVNWEQDQMSDSDIVVFYFDPSTKSPITLLELGLTLGHKNQCVIVCCPEGFWRKGNVDIVCSRASKSLVTQVSSYADLITSLKDHLKYADVSPR